MKKPLDPDLVAFVTALARYHARKDHEAVSRSLSLPYGGTGFPPMLHFVGFKDDRYHNAVKTFGRPDFIHRFWDQRAIAEVMPGDVVIFAEGDEHQPVSPYTYDDSASF